MANPYSFDIGHFTHLLQGRRNALRDSIRDALLRSDSEPFIQIADQVHETEDEALADLLVDINLAEVDRLIGELRDVNAAMRRIVVGTYGYCIQCHDPIHAARLEAYPTATRCLPCQQLQERPGTTPSRPSL
jgi:RNA polymerase-binding transcription factor DksA